jgi:tetratricopeptide (TPR) repeat protein
MGEIYRRMGDYPKALENVKKALKINPKSSLIQGNLGIIYANLGDNSRARECYAYALSLNPRDPLLLCNYASSLLADEMIDEAELYYGKCIEADSTYARAYNDLAFIKLNYRQDKELGYELAARAADLAPDNLEILDSYGSICGYLGFGEEAISVYRHLIELDPDNFSWHHNLARQYLESNRKPEAINHLKKALELRPGSEPVLKDLTELLYEAERYDETLPLLLQLDNLGSDDAEHYLRLGRCYYQQDDLPKTRLYWNLALDQVPANHPLMAALSLVECDLKHYSRALEYIDQALTLDVYNAEYLRIKSLCLAKLDRKQEAIAILRALIQSDPSVPSLIESGRYLVYIEAYDQAMEYLKQAVAIDHNIVSDLLDDPDFECLRGADRLVEVLNGEL